MLTTDHTSTVLLALLRAGTDFETPAGTDFAGTDWSAVCKLAARQNVAATTWHGLERLVAAGLIPEADQPARALKLQWACTAENVRTRYRRQERTIAQLARFFNSHDIRMMVLKGYGLSRCYPDPESRSCSDIDIWLFDEQERADALLSAEKSVEIDNHHHHHTVFTVNGIMVENHYDFLNIHAHLSNRRIERRLREIVAQQPCETISVEGERVYLPPADFNALFLLRHAGGHFAAVEIELRHLADWALFVRRYHAQIDWEALETFSREMNMHRFLHGLNALAIECLGMDPAWIPPFERDPETEQRMLDDILRPEFSDKQPKGLLAGIWYKYRRWQANSWKHHMVHKENRFVTFWVQVVSHLRKPHSLR